jgi:hypothetical protein
MCAVLASFEGARREKVRDGDGAFRDCYGNQPGALQSTGIGPPHSRVLATIAFTFARVCERGTRQQVYAPHHRANQSLDMAPEMGCRDGTEIELDVVLTAATAQRLATEIFAIVGPEDVHQAAEGPLQTAETARQKPRLFG